MQTHQRFPSVFDKIMFPFRVSFLKSIRCSGARVTKRNTYIYFKHVEQKKKEILSPNPKSITTYLLASDYDDSRHFSFKRMRLCIKVQLVSINNITVMLSCIFVIDVIKYSALMKYMLSPHFLLNKTDACTYITISTFTCIKISISAIL